MSRSSIVPTKSFLPYNVTFANSKNEHLGIFGNYYSAYPHVSLYLVFLLPPMPFPALFARLTPVQNPASGSSL